MPDGSSSNAQPGRQPHASPPAMQQPRLPAPSPPATPQPRPPASSPLRTHARVVIAHHLILHGYGHWLPNDPRGSGSQQIREDKLADLGDIHLGRRRIQPPRETVRMFYRQATPRLTHAPLWFDDSSRQIVAAAIARTLDREHYTLYACAVLRNHVHLCIRRHRDRGRQIWQRLADATRDALHEHPGIHPEHPVWSDRPYSVFLYTPDDIRRVIAYIANNPLKEGLPPQPWAFVRPYDGWPFAGRRNQYPASDRRGG